MEKNKKLNSTDLMMAKGTMTIAMFRDMMKDALASCIEGCTLEDQDARKNNGVVCHGICIRDPERNIAPCIYLDDAFEDYQNGRNFNEIVTAFVKNYEQNRPLFDFDTTLVTDYGRVKNSICLKIVNTKLNRELLSDVPHVQFLDLSVVFYILLDDLLGKNASILVKNEHMVNWGVDTDTVYEMAKANTQRLLGEKIVPMKSIIESILESRDNKENDCLPELESCGMYVATSRTQFNGAYVFLNDSLLSGFADETGSSFFYIIPSSIHELLFLPGDINMEPEDIRKMIVDVNANCVEPEEVLSNNVYRYQRETGFVEIL